MGSFAATGYARRANGHNFSSLNLTEIVSLNAGDVVAINVQRDANLGTATMRSSGSSNFYIIKLD